MIDPQPTSADAAADDAAHAPTNPAYHRRVVRRDQRAEPTDPTTIEIPAHEAASIHASDTEPRWITAIGAHMHISVGGSISIPLFAHATATLITQPTVVAPAASPQHVRVFRERPDGARLHERIHDSRGDV